MSRSAQRPIPSANGLYTRMERVVLEHVLVLHPRRLPIPRTRPKPVDAATYEANLDALPAWARKRIESGEELAR